MALDLDKMTKGDLKHSDERFDEVKTFINKVDKADLPKVTDLDEDRELDANIDSMIARWKNSAKK